MNERITLYTPPFEYINSYFQMVDVAVEYGIKNLETINIFELLTPNVEFAHRLRKYADEKGVKFPCVSVGINLIGEKDGRQNIEMTKKYADVAKILGAPYLHHTIAYEYMNPEVVLSHKEDCFEKGIQAVREIYDYAQNIGIKCIYECQGYIFNNCDNFAKFIETVGRDIGVVADYGNIVFADDVIENFIPAFSDRIVNVHIKDYLVENKDDTSGWKGYVSSSCKRISNCVLGKGSVNFDLALEKLKKMNYKGLFALEANSKGENEKDKFRYNLEFLESYISKLG